MKNTKCFSGRKLHEDETGAVAVVEAAIVFPIVIFVLVILLVLGNVFYQQAKLDAMAVQAAEYLSAYYTHPQLNDAPTTDPKQKKLYPYRYWASNEGVSANAQAKIILRNWISSSDSGMFTGMDISKARIVDCSIDGNMFYHTATVRLQYQFTFFPLKLLGFDATLPLMSTATETAAVDPAELIRITDLTVDLYSELDSNYDLSGRLKSALGSLGK